MNKLYVKNPRTNRYVQVGGATHKRLLNQYGGNTDSDLEVIREQIGKYETHMGKEPSKINRLLAEEIHNLKEEMDYGDISVEEAIAGLLNIFNLMKKAGFKYAVENAAPGPGTKIKALIVNTYGPISQEAPPSFY